jgi:hypothetical protein
MKKSFLIIIIFVSGVSLSYSQMTIIACPGTGVECIATVTNADGSSATTYSQKDKNGDSIIIKNN